MQVEPPSSEPFSSLQQSLPSQTLRQPLQQIQPNNVLDSPTPEIPGLPKNAYGLESFADYAAAVKRVKAGLPPTEPLTPPDRSNPIIIQGIKFKYWDPNYPESDTSDTESETTALQPPASQNDSLKSTWSAGTPRKSILRQSTSSLPVVRESELPIPDEPQNQLVYDYASSASPASRRTSRLSSRRFSIDAGVQSEPTEVQNTEEEVVRVAAAKRVSARRNSILPVRRESLVHGLAGFTGVGRADSGAVICVANGKKFELVVDAYDRDNSNEIAVQCSGLEIDSEIEALFGQSSNEEVIDVDAEDETAETGENVGEEPAVQEGDVPMQTIDTNGDQLNEVPSPEQLRSNNVVFMNPEVSAIPNLENILVPSPRESRKTTPAVATPTHLSLRSDLEDLNRDETTQDEIVATSAQAANKRLILPSTSKLKVRVSAPPRVTASEPAPAGNLPESQLEVQQEGQSPESATPAIQFVEQPQPTPVHAIADPTKTPTQSISLDIVRQRSLSLKPGDFVPSSAQHNALQAVQSRILQLAAIRGVDIRPTASAYQLAAMATLSPKSYLRAVQPQPRVVFAFASPGGTGPVGGVNVAPPNLMSTPPVATLAVAPDPLVRTALVGAPRRSHVSFPRTGLSTPSHDRRAVSGVQQRPRSSAITPHVDLDTEALITPAPLQNAAQNTESELVPSRRTGSTVGTKAKSRASSQAAGSEANKASSSAALSGRSQDIAEHHVDLVSDGDDDYNDALPEMDDDAMEIAEEMQPEADIQPEPETEPKAEVKPELVKSRSRKASVASSRSRASRKTQPSSGSQRRQSSSVTQVVEGEADEFSEADLSVGNVEEEPENVDTEGEGEEREVRKKKPSRKAKSTKKTKTGGLKTGKRTGQKRWRELKSLPTTQVNLNENNEEGGLRRSKRQRFPRLKFWKNETVSYERRLSQAIPTIAEVIVEVGGESESDDDTWFGRR